MRDYEITIVIDGRPRSGRWTLRQGGKVHVTCIWGAHTLDCAPPLRPESVAGQALEQIFHAFHRERAEMLEREARELAAVNAYWDAENEKARPPRRGSRAKVGAPDVGGAGSGYEAKRTRKPAGVTPAPADRSPPADA